MEEFRVQRIAADVILPTKAHANDAGWDLYAYLPSDLILSKGNRVLISTGCKFAIPEGYYGHIVDRSGNALKLGLHVLGGIVDSNFRGIVQVILINLDNLGHDNVTIKNGDRIAQMVITKIHTGTMKEVKELDDTERSSNGFGSSGQ